ncbi:hypothetical protein KEM55_001883 [Ascosphaera atra]|nr:hypothetical protein KEM55_001883 [Ascosphaera atra]
MSTLTDPQMGLYPVDFCTLGMFIIDDLEFEDPPRKIVDMIGGAASFAALGARMVAGKKNGHKVSWIIDAGSDFTQELRDKLEEWGTDIVFRENKDRLTTRGWNGYPKGANEERRFKYMAPKLRLEPCDLNESQVFARGFHLICFAPRAISIVKDIMQRRTEIARRKGFNEPPRPLFVWEPVPDRCIPEEREAITEACRYVDVVSPNELELGTMFGNGGWSPNNARDMAEAQKLLESGIGPDGKGLLLVRMGKDGCCALSRGHCASLPAYQYPKVVDPTGGGNSFLGAFTQALVTSERAPVNNAIFAIKCLENWSDVKKAWEGQLQVPAALACATVAASFVIEQLGTPELSADSKVDVWNGEVYDDRLEKYLKARAAQA